MKTEGLELFAQVLDGNREEPIEVVVVEVELGEGGRVVKLERQRVGQIVDGDN